MLSRIGYAECLILLYRLKNNINYGFSSYREDKIGVLNESFYNYWEDAGRWKIALLKDTLNLIKISQTAISKEFILSSPPHSLKVMMGSPYTRPVVESKSLLVGLDNKLFRIRTLNSGYTVVQFSPVLNIYNHIIDFIYKPF